MERWGGVTMVISKTFLVTCALLIFVIFTEGCAYVKKKKRNTLHNYPIIKGQECPYEGSNKRYKPVNKWRNAFFKLDK